MRIKIFFILLLATCFYFVPVFDWNLQWRNIFKYDLLFFIVVSLLLFLNTRKMEPRIIIASMCFVIITVLFFRCYDFVTTEHQLVVNINKNYYIQKKKSVRLLFQMPEYSIEKRMNSFLKKTEIKLRGDFNSYRQISDTGIIIMRLRKLFDGNNGYDTVFLEIRPDKLTVIPPAVRSVRKKDE